MCPKRKSHQQRRTQSPGAQSNQRMENSLASFPMFAGLGKSDIGRLVEIAVRRSFAKGETIFIEGDEALGFYLLERGRVKIYKLSPEGKEHILHIIEPGFSFAEACIFFEELKCPASADALEESTTIFFSRSSFLDALQKSTSLGMRMLGSMARWVRLMAEEVSEISLSTVEGRFVSYLVGLAGRRKAAFASGTSLSLDVSKSVLAARLGTIPETLSRTLRKLQDRGCIRVERGNITILDSQGLLDMLE